MDIKVHKSKDHYEIYINGEWYCDCRLNELNETLEEIENA